MARSHLEGYPHLRKFANYQVHQRVCTKKKTPAGSRQSPARACRVSRVGPTASTPCSRLERRLSFTLAGFRGGGAIGYFLRCRDVPALRRRWRWYSEKTLERYVQEGMYYLESLSLPTRAANLVAELTDLAPQVFHETAAALLARLPLQHRRSTSGKGRGGSCLSRHRAQWAGGESELCRGSVSQHLDLNS